MFISPSEPAIALTEEEKEVDQFLYSYYSAMNDSSLSKVSKLFQREAVLISPEGDKYKGIDEIESYYENIWRGLEKFEIRKKLLSIEVKDNYAKVSYCSKSIERSPAARMENIKTFRDDFVLVKQDDDWRIIGLTISSELYEVI
jgi:uncharacterized protein (TIGR02246 family)